MRRRVWRYYTQGEWHLMEIDTEQNLCRTVCGLFGRDDPFLDQRDEVPKYPGPKGGVQRNVCQECLWGKSAM